MKKLLVLVLGVFVSLQVLGIEAKAAKETKETKAVVVKEAKAIKETEAAKNPEVTIKTSKGEIEVELFLDKAPLSVNNFLNYVKKGHYKGTIFHRVINDFMIQGGGFDEKMVEKKTDKPIKNEAANGLKNEVGTLAMARTNEVDSATAQFFINVSNNGFLDHREKTPAGFGYAVFGKVTSGMPVVNMIKAVKTGSRAGYEDVPVDAVVILDIVKKK